MLKYKKGAIFKERAYFILTQHSILIVGEWPL